MINSDLPKSAAFAGANVSKFCYYVKTIMQRDIFRKVEDLYHACVTMRDHA